jgi:hypothetical protein
LTFVIPFSVYRELLLRVDAPKDFLYEENVRFYIDREAVDMSERRILNYFDTRVKMLLEKLDAKGFVDEKGIGYVVPLKIKELGNRRHYRLPDIRMMGKKVLLICENALIAEAIAKMFRYFLYEVDEGVEAYKKRGSNLAAYDIFVLDQALYNDGIHNLVREVQKKKTLKFVLVTKAVSTAMKQDELVSAYLVKPVMQESVFELIVALYDEDAKTGRIQMDEDIRIIDMERHIDDAFEKSEKAYIEMLRRQHSYRHIFEEEKSDGALDLEREEAEWERLPVLDTLAGVSRNKDSRSVYAAALREFLEKFNRSDYYFREIVTGKASLQIKEFAQDLEKSSHNIGAKRMENLAKRIGLMLVYEKIDELKVYVNKYHTELKKLIVEISRYLKQVGEEGRGE